MEALFEDTGVPLSGSFTLRSPRRNMRGVRPLIIVSLVAFAGCDAGTVATSKSPATKPASKEAPETLGVRIESEPFGETKDGIPVTRYLLANDRGMTVSIINYGATVTSIELPDRNKKTANVVLGFPTLDGYLGKDPYFGCIVGRYANRIAKGKFTLNGKMYSLSINDGPNHMHGGLKSFSDVVWSARPATPSADGKSAGLELMYESRDGEEGYPGNVKTTVVYTLNDANELRIDYRAVSDRPTIINLTSHIYWNLKGAGTGDIFNEVLQLDADKYLPSDSTLIPTGEMKSVKGTPMDFTSPFAIGARLKEVDGGGVKGYDHCYVLNPRSDPLKQAAARVEDPDSGRVLEIFTTEPGIQFYTGNQLSGKPEDGGFKPYSAFCLECQHFPDSPNHPDFPSTVLEPDKPYTQTTIHRFSAK
jgi:aldose 1-epimerase